MEKNYIYISGLEGSEPVEFTAFQEALRTHVPNIELFWALVWGATLSYMAYRYVMVPLARKILKKKV